MQGVNKSDRFRDHFPDASVETQKRHDLNSATLKLINYMLQGKSMSEIVELLVEKMGTRGKDASGPSDEEAWGEHGKVTELFPYLSSEARDRLKQPDLGRALPREGQGQFEGDQSAEVERNFAHYVRLNFLALLEQKIKIIETIREMTNRSFENTENCRFELIGHLSVGDHFKDLRNKLMSIKPDDFDRVLNCIRQELEKHVGEIIEGEEAKKRERQKLWS